MIDSQGRSQLLAASCSLTNGLCITAAEYDIHKLSAVKISSTCNLRASHTLRKNLPGQKEDFDYGLDRRKQVCAGLSVMKEYSARLLKPMSPSSVTPIRICLLYLCFGCPSRSALEDGSDRG